VRVAGDLAGDVDLAATGCDGDVMVGDGLHQAVGVDQLNGHGVLLFENFAGGNPLIPGL
jgi:hypothetical protein